MKKQISVVTNNLVGSAIGGYVGYNVTKQVVLPCMFCKIVVVLAGVLVGANLSNAIKAKMSAPTASTIK